MFLAILKFVKKLGVVPVLVVFPLGVSAGSVDFYNVHGWTTQRNFQQAQNAINDNDERIAALESTLATYQSMIDQVVAENQALQQRVAELEQDAVPGLGDYISIQLDEQGRPGVFFESVNLHIRSGSGSSLTNGPGSGLGNLVLGYDEAASSSAEYFCTESWSSILQKFLHTEEDCREAGFEWTNSNRTGSHNLIIGAGHNYAGDGNIITGYQNSVSDIYNVVGGMYNYAGHTSTLLGTSNSKGFYQASLLSSSHGFVYNGVMLSSFGSSILSGIGVVMTSSGLESDGQYSTYIENTPFIP